MKSKRAKRGICLIETIAGAAILVPICLFGLDVLTLVLSESINDHLAKDAARSAANQSSRAFASTAALKKVKELRLSSIITAAHLNKIEYRDNSKVSVQTRLDVKLPAPFPFFEACTLYSRSTEAIVANPAAL